MNAVAEIQKFFKSKVFAWNYTCPKPIVVNQGGTSSGKTYGILQTLILKGAEAPNQIITIAGQDIPNLKAGAMRTLGFVLDDSPFLAAFLNGNPNKTDRIWTFNNGSIMEFKSFDDEQDAKGGRRDYLFMNEANGISYKIYDQLQVRTSKQIFLDYNPTCSFWVHKKLIGRDDVQLILSNYKHNPFLPKEIVRKIERWKGADSEKWKVYGLGKTGKLEGIIFPNIRWCEEMPKHYSKEAYGMDFGFTNSYTTLVRIVLSEGRLFAQLLLYARGMDGQEIAQWLADNGFQKRKTIIADSAAPETIYTIYKAGYKRVWSCKKGKGSVKDGISLIKGYGTLNIVDDEAGHWKDEQLNYVWVEDRIEGELTTEPVKDPCHAFDALRYGMQDITRVRTNSATVA